MDIFWVKENFRIFSTQLKKLTLLGLKQDPFIIALLRIIAFLNEFNLVKKIIQLYGFA